MPTPEIPNLHDATLERVIVDWTARSASIHCATVSRGPVVLLVSGISEVRIDCRQPWGPSVSINQTYVDDSNQPEVALYVEMQSGDPIFVLGKGLEVQEPRT
jgi:hypothetical protein